MKIPYDLWDVIIDRITLFITMNKNITHNTPWAQY